MRKGKPYLVIGIIFVLVLSFSKFGFAEKPNALSQETVEFINKTNDILQSMNDKIKEKTEGINSGSVQDSYRLETEITAVIAGYKEQIEAIAAPAKCVEFKEIIVKLMDLMGQMHLALSKGDVGKYKLLASEVTNY